MFLGTPEAAAVPLRALVASGHEVALVVSRPDRRRGRRSPPEPSPVKAAALELGLPVTEEMADVVEVGADLGVVVAYGRIIGTEVLSRLPMVNLHFSMLPRWRGAAPVERAILAGDDETGVCLMAIDEGLDTGPLYGCRRTAIRVEEGASELRARLVELGTELLVEALAAGPEGLGAPVAQVGEPTHAAKVDPSELRLDWSRPADELARVVRLGRSWTTIQGRRLLVLRAGAVAAPGPSSPGALRGLVVGTGAGGLELVEVQPESRAPTAARDWLLGTRLADGAMLGT